MTLHNLFFFFKPSWSPYLHMYLGLGLLPINFRADKIQITAQGKSGITDTNMLHELWRAISIWMVVWKSWVCLTNHDEHWVARAEWVMERVEREPERFSPRRLPAPCAQWGRAGTAGGAGEDFMYSLKICAHLQEHLWEPGLICSRTPSNIFVTPDISSCEAMVNGCW